ncbi:M48 family metallopeptidase [Thalassomonas sp. M1454]|uniref:M48 family metallopeptidase n=1 Tax=Thalassomonas sp. M1454 TaxID=2594477 RepID=UPI00117CE878|nr:SprT family zinc-dependent metalloprotease [Thalassomonas sp. M1454]TRX53993.1 M48 family metallopeptidase [Thalassomonas sp. M1454]
MQVKQPLQVPEYELVRSNKRKTVSLQVKASKVRVLAPTSICQNEISRLVASKAQWLWRKIDEQQLHLSNKSERQFCSGEIFYYLGAPYKLDIRLLNKVDKAVELDLDKQVIIINLDNTHLDKQPNEEKQKQLAKQQLQHWLVEQAHLLFTQRIDELQKITGITIQSLKIRHYKSRWGSCDAKHRINLNWLLIMAPMSVIDYVIIHELCHIKHLNHSAKFWQLVKRFFPNPDAAKVWLKQHQSHLYWI